MATPVTALTTLAEAIEWAESRWLERPVPLRLTVHDTEGELGGLRWSVPFERTLGAQAGHTIERDEQEPCYHVGHPIGVSLFECRCGGTGMQTVRRLRYRYPMWNAWVRLTHARNDTRHAHPAQLVAGLAAMGWDARRAAERMGLPWDLAEALFLMALRKLHGRYEEGPVGRVGWTQKSDSQRAAEEAA